MQTRIENRRIEAASSRFPTATKVYTHSKIYMHHLYDQCLNHARVMYEYVVSVQPNFQLVFNILNSDCKGYSIVSRTKYICSRIFNLVTHAHINVCDVVKKIASFFDKIEFRNSISQKKEKNTKK